MLKIGCHLSSTKGFFAMGESALKIGANTFQFFTRNPRGSKAKNIDLEDIKKLLKLMKENNFGQILAHAPYTLNLCSNDESKREFARQIMIDDLKRLENLPNQLYNIHPGNHLKQGSEKGIEQIACGLNSIITPEQTTTILLETMAGKGTEVGRNFLEIKMILDEVKEKDKVGVCLDTCHIFDAGYDIVNNLDIVIEDFDKVVGLDKLKAIHLNDSKNILGSRKDRHECIGKGHIGLDALMNIVNNRKLENIPLFLETPNDLQGYEEEIKLIKSLYKKE